MKPLFTVRFQLQDQQKDITYYSIIECLEDLGLKSIVNEGLITDCTIHAGGKRIAGVPVLKWERMMDAVISNATVILRHRYQ